MSVSELSDHGGSSDGGRNRREETARVLGGAMDEANTAEYRLRYEAAVFGSADEAFEPRWERIRTIVRSHHRTAVQEAWRDAIHAGWTQQELQSAGFGDSPER